MSGCTQPLPLSLIWQPDDLQNYKVHFARYNGQYEPLDVYVRDFREWQSWQEYRPGRDDFNRPLIFSLLKDYQTASEWIFGGIWQITARHPDRYEVALSDELCPLIGRLRLHCDHRDRATRCRMESYFDSFAVVAIDREAYAGRAFPGLSSLTVALSDFRDIHERAKPDWHGALANLKGIYLLRDRTDGAMYVGSAYGESGIWARWAQYASSGHGGNAQTIERFGENPVRYGHDHIDLTLLDPMLPSVSDSEVIARENHWKVVLGTRDPANLNSN